MLLRFRVTNHASLRDEQELSLIAERGRAERAERAVPRGPQRTVPVAAIYGPNASGKSNVIDALNWMRWAALDSFRAWDPAGGVPRRPFALRRGPDHPSRYAMDLVVSGVRYSYGFACDDDRITEEWLFSYPEGKPRRLLELRAGQEPYFGRTLTGAPRTLARLLRPNSLFLSVAAAQGHELLGSVYRWFRHTLRTATDHDFAARLDYTVKHYLPDGRRRGLLLELLHLADLGVGGMTVAPAEPEEEAERERLTAALRQAMGHELVTVEDSPVDRIRLEHRTSEGDFALRLSEESSGTRTWIGLLGPVLATLTHGAVLCVDELDARLHPHLADVLVGLFQSASTNPHGAQLVFSTHESSLLGSTSRTELRRDQVWFTEKGLDGATELFPMTDFQVRDSSASAENKEKRYLVGRYGAVPFFDSELLHTIVDQVRDGRGVGPEQAAEAGRDEAA